MLDLPSSQDSLVRHIGSVVVVCEILVPQPGIKPVPSTVEAQNLNHWTTKGSPLEVIFDTFCLYCLQSKPSLVYSALTLFSIRFHHFITLMGTETQKFSHIVLLLPRLNETSGILKKLQVREA